MRLFIPLLITLCLLACKSFTPHWEVVESPLDVHLRGLSVVNDNVVWVSGANGSFAVTENSGESWYSGQVEGAETLDFRDVEGRSSKIAFLMSAGFPGRIYKTINGGKDWTLQYNDSTEGIFLDGMDFSDDLNGFVFGDPVKESLWILKTTDGGENWKKLNSESLPKTMEGEAGFAASGTGIQVSNGAVSIATGGGKYSRLFRSFDDGKKWEALKTPMTGGEGQGIFSIAFKDEMNGVIIGGNYVDSLNKDHNCVLTNDGGMTWKIPKVKPNGYRSCVTYWKQQKLYIAVGRSGTDYSSDGGKSWLSVGTEGYYACGFGKSKGWAVGRSGKMAIMKIQ